MKFFKGLLVLFLSMGCAEKITEQKLSQLNGYWEIEQVIFADGQTKEFKVNPNIDFIELNNLKGYRKKVQPKFNGSYTTSNDAEPFTIVTVDGNFEFHYNNEMSSWSEKLIHLSENNFKVINADTITYSYKRFQAFNTQN